MSISNYLELKLLDHSLGTTAYTHPSTVYMSLHSANPTDAGNGAEISGNGYTRIEATFGAASAGAAANSAQIEFPIATGSNWAAATHFAIWDASSGGNMLWYGALGATITVTVGNRAAFDIGEVTATLD